MFGILGSIGDGGTAYQTQLGTNTSCSAPRNAERMARIAGRESRVYGCTRSFYPVVNVNRVSSSYFSSSRSFGNDQVRVKELGSDRIKAMREEDASRPV